MRREDKYPADWAQISLRIRYERAQGKCEWCGAPDKTYIKRNRGNLAIWELADTDFMGDQEWTSARYIFLTVAHFDHNTMNNDESNLFALCNRCHLNHDAHYHAENAKRTRQRKAQEAREQSGQMRLDI